MGCEKDRGTMGCEKDRGTMGCEKDRGNAREQFAKWKKDLASEADLDML